ncbi:MAG: thioredoxin domain-containing protein [Candidatus Delongbacteria bacterium]|jgi:thioredoxin 1|nr:thioredoxin domain-containing protein [Candidatus Delongbacteria bacterium]
MGAKKINMRNFEKEVLKSEIPVLVNVCADWCFQCRVVDPLIDDLADEYAGRFKVGTMNYNENKPLGEKYNIKSIPTLLVFIKGEETERYEEVDPEEDLNSILDKYLVKKHKKSKK